MGFELKQNFFYIFNFIINIQLKKEFISTFQLGGDNGVPKLLIFSIIVSLKFLGTDISHISSYTVPVFFQNYN